MKIKVKYLRRSQRVYVACLGNAAEMDEREYLDDFPIKGRGKGDPDVYGYPGDNDQDEDTPIE